MLKTSETISAFVRAADILDTPDKWCKGRERIGYRVCLRGAFGGSMGWKIESLLVATIHRMYPQFGKLGVAAFNDHPSATFDMVRRVLVEALVAAE